jgi:hypothetical protein
VEVRLILRMWGVAVEVWRSFVHFLWGWDVLIPGGDVFRVEFRTFGHAVEYRLIAPVHQGSLGKCQLFVIRYSISLICSSRTKEKVGLVRRGLLNLASKSV